MEIGEILYVITREEWRNWLVENHSTSSEIWLRYFNKQSNKPRIKYDEAVEEALCFGWIDSIAKGLDTESTVQRFSPRRNKSQLSELNRIRIKKMISQGKMTDAGLKSLNQHLVHINGVLIEHEPFVMPEDILDMLKKDPVVWKNFNGFSSNYRQVRIAYIDHARSIPDVFNKRLNFFIKKTRENKIFGSKV